MRCVRGHNEVVAVFGEASGAVKTFANWANSEFMLCTNAAVLSDRVRQSVLTVRFQTQFSIAAAFRSS